MIYGSVCSGIEAATVAWHPLGWKPAWYSEIESFPCAVLAHHYPDVPNLGDMTRLHERPEIRPGTINLLVGGTPCQSFSVAGLRKGLADPRGNLALVFLALLDRLRPQWVVWENVPGVISSWSDAEDRPATADDYAAAGIADPGDGRRGRVAEQTNDFDTFLCGLRELGYHGAWRILDAQFFGVPQRRRRVFVVGHLGDGAPARAVLFERDCLSGNPPPRRVPRQGASGATQTSPRGGSGWGLQVHGPDREDLSHALTAKHSDRQYPSGETYISHALRGEGFDASEDGTGRGTPIIAAHETGQGFWQEGEVAGTLRAEGENRPSRPSNIVAFGSKDSGADASEDVAPTLRAGTHDGSHANAGVPPAVCFTEGNLARGAGPSPSSDITPTLKNDKGRGRSDQDPLIAFTQNSRSEVREIGGDGQVTGAVTSEPGAQCQKYVASFQKRGREGGRNLAVGDDIANALTAPNGGGRSQERNICAASVVRRLTPRECERLQSFPDNYTLIPTYRSKLDTVEIEQLAAYLGIPLPEARELGATPDGPRYKALGNSMCVNVMAWIGRRIQMVQDILESR